MENSSYKDQDSQHEEHRIERESDTTRHSSSRESASEKVRLKEGPWHDKQETEKQYKPEGKSIEEATDPSKLSQL